MQIFNVFFIDQFNHKHSDYCSVIFHQLYLLLVVKMVSYSDRGTRIFQTACCIGAVQSKPGPRSVCAFLANSYGHCHAKQSCKATLTDLVLD